MITRLISTSSSRLNTLYWHIAHTTILVMKNRVLGFAAMDELVQ